ncbi:MAG: lactate racemase domain-containing protein, partial [Anaerolineae bacterium]|nr:lactate racemase domain-containing protein [Anaerolineae bacterium]
DLKIVVGNIEPHQFMGFSGGVKSAAVGLTGKKTINHNHAMMTDPNAKLGEYDRNPARQDVEDAGAMIGIHFALNAILNPRKQIVKVVAGNPRAVMQAGIPLVRSLYQVPVAEPYEIVIASPGGSPKDINLYQAQKALAHAALITRSGGRVILVAACPEGTGSQSYEQWMTGLDSYEAVFARFAVEGFRVGPHKAYQIARDAARVRTFLLSEMRDDLVKHLLLEPIHRIEDALVAGARTAIMPLANATVPLLTVPVS